MSKVNSQVYYYYSRVCGYNSQVCRYDSQVTMDMVMKGGEAKVTPTELASMPRAEAVSAMSAALTNFFVKEHAANKVFFLEFGESI